MPKTLLVVDDSRTIREAARLSLTGEGWDVVEASSQPEALREARTRSPDAVLCDVGLAGDDGYSFCRELRNAAPGWEIPILLMGSGVDPAAARAAGVGQILPKPFASDELVEALEAAAEFQLPLEAGGASGTRSSDGLSDPLGSLAAEEAAPDAPVEIIDLSGEEDFEELELLDDLEPVAAAPVAAPLKPWDPTGWPLTAAGRPDPAEAEDDTFSLALEELDEDRPAIDLSASEPAGESELSFEEPDLPASPSPSSAAIELAAGLGFDLGALAPSVPAETPAPFEDLALEETPYSYEPPPQAPEAQAAAFVPVAPPDTDELAFAPPRVDGLAAAVAAGTEKAVREALTQSLSAEALVPLVERIVERVVWEVVPQVAERLIREAIEKLRTAPPE